MPRETPSPIDLPAPPLERPGLGWASGVITIATLVLLAANAISLDDWADDLTPGPAQARLAAITAEWVTITDAIGAPRAWLHARWKQAEAWRFGAPIPRSG